MKKIILLLVAFTLVLTLAVQSTYAATGPIDFNSGFEWDGPDINVTYDNETNKFSTDFDVEDYKVDNDGETYYVSTLGDDGNAGLTEDTPLATVHAAMDKIDVNTIMIAEGEYYLGSAFNNQTYDSREINIIGVGDVILAAMTDDATWALEDGYTATFSASMSNVTDVYDTTSTDADGAWEKLTLVGSIGLVESTPGSYYMGTAPNMIYLHTDTGVIPTSDILLNRNVYSLRFTGDSTVYLENLTIQGGQGIMLEESTMFAKDINVLYSNISGISVMSSNLYLEDATITYNDSDGIGYSNILDPTVIHYALEYDVTSAYNGLESVADNSNGSSMHANQRGIRINGSYHDNKGPNIIDVDSAQSINYGTIAYDSRATDENWSIDYHIQQQTEDNKMWLINKRYVVSSSDYIYLGTIEHLYDLTYYVVDFDTNDGRLLLDLFVLDGEIVQDEPLTSKTSYTFAGWYLDEELSNEFDFSTTAIDDDIELYARWVPQTSGTIILGAGGLTLTQWSLIGLVVIIVVAYFGFSKKGRKAIGLK